MTNIVSALNCSTVQEASVFEPLQLTKALILAKHPFFGSLLLDLMEIRLSSDIPTLGTDGKYVIVNPEFFEDLEPQHRVAALCHEIGHAMWLHMPRARAYESSGLFGHPFSPTLWNVAGDFLVNRLLKDAGVGALKDTWLYSDKYTLDMDILEVYQDLLQQFPPQKGKGSGSGSGSACKYQPQDTHMTPEGYSPGATESDWQHAIKAAAARAKAMDNLPGALEQFINDFTESKVDWREQLRMSLTRTFSSDSSTWKRPHRRRIWMPGIYMPSRTGFGAGEIYVWMDTSGSIRQEEYEAYFGELYEILSTCTPERLFLGFCDARVNGVHQLDSPDEIKSYLNKIPGGGGTDFRPAWDHMITNGAQPDAVVYLTDMYGSFPDESPWDTIWVATSDVEGPFGKTIRLTLDR